MLLLFFLKIPIVTLVCYSLETWLRNALADCLESSNDFAIAHGLFSTQEKCLKFFSLRDIFYYYYF